MIKNVQCMPAPIAAAWDAFENETRPFYKLHRLVDSYETLIKYTAILAVQNFYAAKMAEDFPTTDLKIREYIALPSLGHWADFLQDVLRCFTERTNELICPELFSFYFESSRKKKKPLQKYFASQGASERIIELRNTYLGHGATLEDKKSEQLLAEHTPHLNTLLQHAEFLKELPLFVVHSEVERGMYHLKPMMGTHYQTATPVMLESEQLPRHHVIVRNPNTQCILDLHPLLVYLKCTEKLAMWDENRSKIVGTTECQQQNVFFFNNHKKSQIDFLEYTNGHHSRYKKPNPLPEEFLSRFPKPEKPSVADHKRDRFERLTATLTEHFVGREEELQALHRFVENSAKRVIVVVGAPGQGKSALLAKWSLQHTTSCHFIREGDENTLETHRIFENLALQLSEQYQLKYTQPNSPDPYKYQRAFLDMLNAASDKASKPVLVVIDGLDEAQRTLKRRDLHALTIVNWLPEPGQLPDNCRLMVSTRPELVRQQDFSAKFGWDKAEKLELGRMDEGDVRALLYQVRSKYDVLDNPQYVEMIVKRSEGSPLYLRMLLEDLSEGRIVFGESDMLPKGVQAYFERILENIEGEGRTREMPDIETLVQAKHETLILSVEQGFLTREQADSILELERQALQGKAGIKSSELLVLFCIAKAPISLREAAAILNAELPDTQRAFDIIRTVLIQSEEHQEGHFTIFHAGFREYVLDLGNYADSRFNSYEKIITDVSERLLSYCADWHTHQSHYALEWLPTHLVEAERVDELKELLLDLNFLEEKTNLYSINDTIRDFDLLLKKNETLDLLGRSLRLEIHHLNSETTQYFLPQLYSRLAEFPPHRTQLLRSRFQIAFDKSRLLPANWLKRMNYCIGRLEEGLLYSQRGHSEFIYDIAFSPDGKRIASGGGSSSNDEGTLSLWDVQAGRELNTLALYSSNTILSLDFSPDESKIISGGGNRDGNITLWDATTGKELKILITPSKLVWFVAFSPDGKLVVFSGNDNEEKGDLTLWDVEAGKILKVLVEDSEGANYPVFSPDGKLIASCGGTKNGLIKLWDVATGRKVKNIIGHTETIYSVAFSPDSKQIISGSADGTIKLWDIFTAQELKTFMGHSQSIFSVALSPDGKQIASGSGDTTIKLWDIVTGRELKTFTGHSDPITSVAFSPNGDKIASCSSDGTFKLWEIGVNRKLSLSIGHSNTILSAAFSADGSQFVSISPYKARFWDTATGSELRSPIPNDEFIPLSIAFSKDCEQIISLGVLGFSEDKGSLNGIKVWNITTDETPQTSSIPMSWFQKNSLSIRIAVQELRQFEAIVALSQLSDEKLDSLKQSANEELELILPYVNELKMFAIRELCHNDLIAMYPSFTPFALSGDGKLAASVYEATNIEIWDVEKDAALSSLVGHSDEIKSIAFSPDSKLFVSGSWDRTIRVWDIGTSNVLLTFSVDDPILHIRFSPDGREIWAADNYHRPRIYRFKMIGRDDR